MLQPKVIEVQGFQVSLVPLNAIKAARLDKKVTGLVLPLLAGLDLDNLAKVDVSDLTGRLAEVVTGLPDESLEALLVESLSGSTIIPPGQAAIEITGPGALNQAFTGELDALYQCVWEAWKFNRLSPFRLAARFGVKMPTTPTSGPETSEAKPSGLKLAM